MTSLSDDLVGLDAPEAAFMRAAEAGTLHHAWLIAGMEGIGKASLAKKLGAELVGGGPQRDALLAARSHPDFRLVEREVWDKSNTSRIVPYDQRKEDDPVARSIRIAQIRALEPVLAVRPSLGERRVIVIDAAEDMERNAANALLKSLEEPPAGTVFLLVSHAPGRLLPTIRSRCRLLRVEPLSDDDLRRVLSRRLPDASADELATLVRIGEGSPGRALRYAGLEIAALDAALAAIAREGDPSNARRAKLAKELSLKAAQKRYEAFLDLAPTTIARAAALRHGDDLRVTLDAHDEARALAGSARGLSLDPHGTVFEMAGIVARLASAA